MKKLGLLALGGFMACIVLANYAITHWGRIAFPGGPHMVTLLGWTGPSGLLFVGLSFTCRDVAQLALGRWAILAAIGVGAVLSFFVAPSLAWASAAAFFVSETADWIVYTPLAERGRWGLALLLSNTVGSAVDTLVFLWLAFHSLAFFEGQFVIKALMVAPAILVLMPFRFRQRRNGALSGDFALRASRG